MSNRHGENYLPFFKRGKELKIQNKEEIKKRIMDSLEVRE